MPKSTKKKKDKAADFTVCDLIPRNELFAEIIYRKPSSSSEKASKHRAMLLIRRSRLDVSNALLS